MSYLKLLFFFFVGMMFCFIGGILLKNVKDYFSLLNIVCVGGLWVVLKELVVVGDWVGIIKFVVEVCVLCG